MIVIMLSCFVGCQEDKDIQKDNSSINNGSFIDDNTSKVPVVIVDDEDEDSSKTQSEKDEIIDEWENIAPDIEVEVNPSDSSVPNESKPNNSSTDITSSEKEESDNNSSENQSSDDTSSKEEEVSKPNRPDDGYFDVAV